MTAIVSSAALTAAIAAADGASPGAKDAAYIDSLIATIGSGYKRVLRRNGSTVWAGTAGGSLTRTGTQMIIASMSGNASASADIASGTWTHRIEKGSDAAVYVESAVGAAGSGLPGILSASLVSGQSATLASAALNAPGFDTATSSVDTMIAHMGTNTVILPGAADRDANNGGGVISGADLRSVAIPPWWGGNTFSGSRTYWTVLQPWYVVWDVFGHQADLNSRLAVDDLELYRLSDGDGSWTLLSSSNGPPGDSFNRDVVTPGAGGVVASGRPESDGSWSIKITPGGQIYHGYRGQVGPGDFDPATLLGLHVRIKARKILDDPGGVDDRSLARYSVQVGLDAYPYPGVTLSEANASYWPGLIYSRQIEITATGTWQSVYASNLGSPPSRAVDTSVTRNARHFLTEAAFRALPPP